MKDEVREKIADKMHEAWSGWMAYLFRKSTCNRDGTITIPKWAVERWSKQVDTHYKDLPEDQKQSDREEADIILAIPEIKEAFMKAGIADELVREVNMLHKEVDRVNRKRESLEKLILEDCRKLNHPTLTIKRTCPECNGHSTLLERNGYNRPHKVGTPFGFGTLKTCPSCTSGKQTRPLNKLEDVELWVEEIIDTDRKVLMCDLNQTLKDEGWEIDESFL